MTTRFFQLLTLVFLLLLPLLTSAQSGGGDDGEDFADPNQSKIDSLLRVINSNVHDTVKARCYCNIGYVADNPDTVLKYSQLSLELCDPSDYGLIGQNYSNEGWAYYMNDESSNAVAAYLESLNNFKKKDDKFHVAVVYVALAKCYHELNVRDSIFPFFNNALDIFTELRDTVYITYVYRAIGNVNDDLGFKDNASLYYLKAIALDSASNNYLDMGGDFLSLANAERDARKALEYAKIAVALFDSIPSQDTYHVLSKYDAYRQMAQAYIAVAQESSQREYADSCYIYVKKVGNTLLTFGGYDNHLHIRMTYAKYLSFVGRHKEAVEVLRESEQYLNHTIRNALIAEFHEVLSDAYEKIGDYKNSMVHFKKMYEYRAAYANDSTLNIISNFKTEDALRYQEAEKRHLYAEKRRMRTVVISLIVGLILVSLLIFYIGRALEIKHKANVELSEKNSLLNAQKVEIATQRDKIAAQKDIITDQWHEVEIANYKLISSIHYALRIQKAVVSSEADVKAIFPDSFIYYRPRDIVSGDYYRVVNCGRYSVMVTADCTGHGIPGAFLSMLGISALKEFLVSERDAENPGTVLDRMRDFIKSTLISTQHGKIIDDGMDMTICSYDFEKMEMRYAIANQVAFIVRGSEVIKLKGDSMPVGRYVREKAHFQTLTVKIKKGDMIYTFSDGIQDQVGGQEQRKFLQRNMLDMMVGFAQKPTDEQCKILDKTMIEWRGDNPQVDDMTFVGIRV